MILKLLTLLLLILFSIQTTSAQEPNKSGFVTIKLLKHTPVKDQAMSGTCWSFATISFLESELIKSGKGIFDLSEMFFARNIYVDKALMHYRMMGNNFFTPGGQPHDVIYAINKYGIVPESAYSGLIGGNKIHYHLSMDSILTKYVESLINSKNTETTENWINDYKNLLDNHLGKPPEKFIYNNKKYTPQTFANELGLMPENYIEITSYTHHPFYQPFILESRFNWMMAPYYNVTLNDLMRIIDYAIDNDYTVCWNGDITENTFRYNLGLADLNITDQKANQNFRQKTFDNLTSTVDHVMHIIGTAKNKEGKKYYIIKNSWGETNIHKGFLYMSESYTKIKTISILVNKEAIPDDIKIKK